MKKSFVFSKHKRKEKGFTLVEVLVSLFILTVGVGGAFVAIRTLTMASNINNSRLTASYLGQEGIEIIRNIRDTNWLQSRADSSVSWDDGINEDDWEIDYQTKTLSETNFENCEEESDCMSYNKRFLKKDSNGFFSYSSGDKTPFKRKVNITKKSSEDNGMVVSVTVMWKERGRSNSIEVTEIIQNWIR